MQLQDVFIIEKLQVLNENKSGQLKIRGIFQRADEANNNRRIYPKKILESQIAALNESIKDRRLVGELDHPDYDMVKLSNASHLITALRMEGKEVIGEAEILPTPAGKIIEGLIQGGVKIGISSRGMGTLSESNNGTKMVNDDFRLVTFDIVADPSTRGAFPSLTESKDYKNGKKVIEQTFKKVLGERTALKILEKKIDNKLSESLMRRSKGEGRRAYFHALRKTSKDTYDKQASRVAVKPDTSVHDEPKKKPLVNYHPEDSQGEFDQTGNKVNREDEGTKFTTRLDTMKQNRHQGKKGEKSGDVSYKANYNKKANPDNSTPKEKDAKGNEDIGDNKAGLDLVNYSKKSEKLPENSLNFFDRFRNLLGESNAARKAVTKPNREKNRIGPLGIKGKRSDMPDPVTPGKKMMQTKGGSKAIRQHDMNMGMGRKSAFLKKRADNDVKIKSKHGASWRESTASSFYTRFKLLLEKKDTLKVYNDIKAKNLKSNPKGSKGQK